MHIIQVNQGDAAILIQAGSEYISLMFDFDDRVLFHSDLDLIHAVVWQYYPSCGASIPLPQLPNYSANISYLFADSEVMKMLVLVFLSCVIV